MVVEASMRAWRLEPSPEMRTVALVVGGSCILTELLIAIDEDNFDFEGLGGLLGD